MSKKKKNTAKKPKKVVVKPFCNGTMTNTAFFSMIRSILRKRTMFWKPITECKNKQRIPYIGPNKLRKWSYICEGCGKEFDSKGVKVHHMVPAGELNSFADLGPFVERLFCDSDKLKLVCDKCHDKEHDKLI